MPKDQGAYGSGPGGGFGVKHGDIASPQGPCGYDVTGTSGDTVKGGVDYPPFGQYKESPSNIPTTTFDGLKANQQASGEISTPMDNPSAAMPGVRGSDGTGPTDGGSKISSPWSGPWGNTPGK